MNSLLSQEKTFTYQPIKRYTGSRANVFSGAYAALYEMIMNSYGKEIPFPMTKDNGHPHLDGRGDIHHRTGGTLSEEEHDKYVEATEAIRLENKRHYFK